MSFVDSGRVSFSNPVRQSLFTYNDAEKKKEKAKTAAFRVNEIHPGIVSALFRNPVFSHRCIDFCLGHKWLQHSHPNAWIHCWRIA